MKTRELKELERSELIDMFITSISGHEKEVEIAYILALFASMKLPPASAIKYEVSELATDELIDLVESGILNSKGGYNEEEKVWNIILNSLKPDKVWDIINNINNYMDRYNSILKPIDELEFNMLRIFVESEAGSNG